jgi:hypothetical protein
MNCTKLEQRHKIWFYTFLFSFVVFIIFVIVLHIFLEFLVNHIQVGLIIKSVILASMVLFEISGIGQFIFYIQLNKANKLSIDDGGKSSKTVKYLSFIIFIMCIINLIFGVFTWFTSS